MNERNPDLYISGVKVKPSAEAREQEIGYERGIITSPYPLSQLVTVAWEGRRGVERWHVDLLDIIRDKRP